MAAQGDASHRLVRGAGARGHRGIGADTALYAINAATGSRGFSGTVIVLPDPGFDLGSPALDGMGRIYVGTMEGVPYCLRQDDGGFIWRFDAEGDCTSPALDGAGRVYGGSADLPVRARRADRRAPLVPHVRGDILLPGGGGAGRFRPRVRLRREHGLETVRGSCKRRVTCGESTLPDYDTP